MLAGSWRARAPACTFSAETLADAVPVLERTGAAGLAWWRLRGSELADDWPARRLGRAYRAQALESGDAERHVGQVARVLGEARVRGLVGKGWAAARLYPSPGLRPRGDVDVYVRPDQYERAVSALASAACCADVHRGLAELDDRDFDEVERRAEVVVADGTELRVLGREDHLRLLALHLLRHGGWRPTWLCDVAAGLEAAVRPAFDWDAFLRGERRRGRWAQATLALAAEVLEARAPDAAAVPVRVPRWLPLALLSQWGTPLTPHGQRLPLVLALRNPRRLAQALRSRWPNPIEATVGVGGAFDESARLPYQLRCCVERTARFLAGRPRLAAWR